MANAINWFEIPAQNIERASEFYKAVLANGDIQINEANGIKMGFLHNGQDGVGGAIVSGEGYKPSQKGSLVYLNGGDNLETPLSRVEGAGGKIELGKTKLSDEIGYFAIFIDSEGNRMAFHSPN